MPATRETYEQHIRAAHAADMDEAQLTELCAGMFQDTGAPMPEPNPQPRKPAAIYTDVELLPAPDANGWITGRNGEQFYNPDPRALAQTLNAAYPEIRLDRNHTSEMSGWRIPPATAFPPTDAIGWFNNFYAADDGRILAGKLEIVDYWASTEIQNRVLRYLSPAIILNRKTRRIITISSVGLLNEPNLIMKALNCATCYTPSEGAPTMTTPTNQDPTNQAAPTPTPTPAPQSEPTQPAPAAGEEQTVALNAAKQRIADLEAEAEQRVKNDVEKALNAAVDAGKITPANKETYTAVALNHKDGLSAGLNAVLALIDAQKSGTGELTQKVIDPNRIIVPNGNSNDALRHGEIMACFLTNTRPEAYREMRKLELNGEADRDSVVEGAEGSRSLVQRQLIKELNAAGIAMVLNAGASTPQVISDLTRSFRNSYNVGLAMGSTFARKISTRITSTGKGEVYGRMDGIKNMRAWTSGDRVINSLGSGAYTLDNVRYELTYGVTVDDINDDNVMVYMPLFQEMGAAAARQEDVMMRDAIKDGKTQQGRDGQYFWDSDHPAPVPGNANATFQNYKAPNAGDTGNRFVVFLDLSKSVNPFIIQEREAANFVAMDAPTDEDVFTSNEYRYGVNYRGAAGYGFHQMAYAAYVPLTRDNVWSIIGAMRGQYDDAGQSPLDAKPTHVLCGPDAERELKKIFENPGLAGTDDNDLYRYVEIIDTAWLDTATFNNYFPANV